MRTASRLALVAPVVVVGFLLLPPFVRPYSPGLDPGYAWGVAESLRPGLVHGRDLAFPYGPLGVLLLGPPEVGLALSSLVYALTVHLAFCAGLAVLCLRAGSRWLAWLAAAALLAIVAGFYTSPENDLSLAVAALVAPALAGSAIAPLAAVCAGALAALGLLVKLSVGTLAGALALAAAVRLALLGRAGRAPLAALVAGGGGVLTLALPLYFGGLGTFVDWLRLEASLATGYASAMSVPGRGSLELVGALPLLALPLAALAARRLRAPGAGLWLALLPALWLAYRHGYVRADGHLYHFDYLLLAWLLLAGVALPAGRARAVWAGVAALSLAVSLWTASRVERPGALDGVKLWTGQMGVGNLWSYLHFTGHVEALARASHEWLAPLRVESAAVARWRRRGTTFDVLPWDLLTMPANGLAWRPNPVLQLYQANTRKLDAWVAAHFASAAAPDALVVHFDPIDGRQLLWEAPATWREVLARYEPASEQPFPGRLVLAKRERAAAWTLRELGPATLEPGEWIDLPEAAAGERVLLALDLRPTPPTALRAALFRTEPMVLALGGEAERAGAFRLVPEVAASGLVVDLPVRGPDDLAALARGGGVASVRRVRLQGAGARGLETPIAGRWLAARLSAGAGRPITPP